MLLDVRVIIIITTNAKDPCLTSAGQRDSGSHPSQLHLGTWRRPQLPHSRSQPEQPSAVLEWMGVGYNQLPQCTHQYPHR